MGALRGSIFRILRVTALTLMIIGGALWLRRTLTSLESEQAVINAEIIQMRTPISGLLEIGDVRPGMLLKKGETLFKAVNPRFGDSESVAQYNSLQTFIEAQQGELTNARQALESAQAERLRARRLYKLDAIPRVELERDETRCALAEKLVASKTEQLARSRERAKGMAEQTAMQKESVVKMPVDGLVWSIPGKSGEQTDVNKLVVEVINPSHIWVDAFFAERRAPELKPGLPATIRSLDNSATWRGRLDSTRAGVGRLAYETTVAVPPPETAKRQIGVRVEAEWEQPFSASEFYGVGRSVQVSFSKVAGRRTVGDALTERCAATLVRLRAAARRVWK